MYLNPLIIKNGLIVTINGNGDIYQGDILIEDKYIREIGANLNYTNAETFDASNYIVIPGLIQTHIHLCQTIFRNIADDLTLLDWLNQKIYPLEARHTPETLRISAQLGLAELMLGGTSTILDMGTVHHMDVVFEELNRSGIRAFCGKTMMDDGNIPDGLSESTRESIDSSLTLLERWHESANGRIKYAFAPRFILSCSENLLIETAKLCQQLNILFHTHAAETIEEVNLVKERYQKDTLSFMAQLGAVGPNLCLAHCVWLNKREKDIVGQQHVKVLHCPSSNLKLGSGIAPIPEYLDQGITVSLGADGAPCNNNLDAFTEMRFAALIQKPKYGPQIMDAETVMRMATVGGAKTLGLENEIGSIEKGKKADLAFVRLDQIHTIPYKNIYSKLVYSTPSSAVEYLMIDGQWTIKNRIIENYNIENIINTAKNTAETFVLN
jgi:cytosine/adenosine deaminase-related metal-dependent hydrolase